jgi:hypothetical protein
LKEEIREVGADHADEIRGSALRADRIPTRISGLKSDKAEKQQHRRRYQNDGKYLIRQRSVA